MVDSRWTEFWASNRDEKWVEINTMRWKMVKKLKKSGEIFN